MKKINALLLTPVVFIAAIVISIILAIVIVVFLAFNPLVWLGLAGIAALVVLAFVIFVGIYLCLLVFGGIYYFLRDTNEPFQRTSSNNYSIEDEKEMGRKQQKV